MELSQSVDFPKPVILEESALLLDYIACNLPATIGYVTTTRELVLPGEQAGGPYKKQRTGVVLEGSLSTENPSSAQTFRKFRAFPSSKNPLLFSGLEFTNLTPEDLGLVQRVQHQISIYFAQRREI